jgi:thioredoxin reductase (NADPH)
LVTLGQPLELDDENRRRMETAGIRVMEAPLVEIAIEDDRIAKIALADGTSHSFDTIYSALGIHPRADLAAALWHRAPARPPNRHRPAPAHLDRGLLRRGDIVTGLNQLGVSMSQGEIAAVDVHNRLRAREGMCLAR